MATERVLGQALAWGFICDEDLEGNQQILPPKPVQRWKMQQIGDKWLLVVGDIPQVNLHPQEAIAFLERRRLSLY
ncbi:MAG TPA: hypothetical protein V6D14_05280 [Coleofasciculaceae cyanobacterium]|jgi:hypothetical protein